VVAFSSKVPRISFLQAMPKIVVLPNYEDKNDLLFFQELKQLIELTPSSSTILFAQHFAPSSSNLNSSIVVSKFNKHGRMFH
jgi:hypothetical protein